MIMKEWAMIILAPVGDNQSIYSCSRNTYWLNMWVNVLISIFLSSLWKNLQV